MNELRHQILDDGRVLITLKGQIARLQPSEVKRFAWAVLNDLEPEEADLSGYVAPIVDFAASRVSNDHHRGPWQQLAILTLLLGGPLYTTNISRKAAVGRNHAAIQLGRLAKRDLVECMIKGRSYSPSLWAITSAGRAFLETYERSHAA